MNTQPTPAEPTAIELDATLRAASDRGRLALDAPPPTAPVDGPAEDTAPAPVDLADDELDALLRDRTTRRETLADPAVKVRLARQDPTIAAEIERWEARAEAAEARAEAKVAAAAGPRPTPTPLAGGGAAPVPPAPPSPESILRAAVAAAQGEPVDHNLRPYVKAGTDVTVTGFSPL